MRRKLKKKVRAKLTRFLYENCLLNRREQEKLGRPVFCCREPANIGASGLSASTG